MPPIGPTAAKIAEAHAVFARLGSKTEAAKALGMSRSTLNTWLNGAVKAVEIRAEIASSESEIVAKLQAENETLKESLQNATRPRYTIRQDIASRGEKLKIVVIGDAHDSPALENKERFTHIGKHINSVRPDAVIQIGDFMSADSVSSHTGNHTLEGKTKPSFEEDICSFRLALDALMSPIGYKPEFHCTIGNHEKRIYAYENEHPEVKGRLSCDLDLAFKDRGWTYSPFAEPTFYGGVAFAHCTLNKMGKPMGGVTSENQSANASLNDVVVGHSHVKRVIRYPKLFGKHLTVVNSGCALPDNFTENYAKHSLTGWSWGVMTLTIKDNHIQDDEWVSMATLKERHG